MNTISRVWNFIRDLLGFRSNSKYVRAYLNDANIKSSIYMSFIVIALEIWMIIRQLNTYIIPNWQTPENMRYSSGFSLLFGMTSLYFLFIMASIAMLLFAIIYVRKRDNKITFIINMVVGGICFLWPLLLILENNVGNIKGTNVNIITTTMLYGSMPLFGVSIIGNALYRRINNKNNTVLSILVITCFALVCLLFGLKVGYSDFISKSKPKMVTCFLTMVIFVACLLIWKPYISIILLTSVFVIFLIMLKSYGTREFLEGDEINYITFLISLTMITVSIYQQRITEAKKDEILIHDAIYDHSIEIHNVTYFNNTILSMPKELKQNKIYLFINLSNFRTINDHKGFDGGDEFLKKFSVKLEEVFYDSICARMSDDHFVVFANESNFRDKLNKLKDEVDALREGLFVMVKAGGYKYVDGENPNKALDKARYACGIIKRKPEVLYMEYSDELNEKFIKRQYIVNHLDEAIENDWIVAFYQPVVWSKNHELCGAEALARWIDPVYGFLSPADFIPILEDTRLIHKLDKKIIDCVCKNMRNALDNGRSIVPISVNFSRLDFELMDVISTLEEIINKYNIDKRYIHVEITESALSNNEAMLQDIVNKLKDNGYAIWLDDFGSGYSSLNVLKDFVFDVIKIDMKFLSNFEKSEKTKDILDCIIQLATRLGMKTLTEGVETKEESEFLEKIGCGRLQGYLFGKPYKVLDFEAKIDNGELIISKEIL